jgi:hypothetical protein
MTMRKVIVFILLFVCAAVYAADADTVSAKPVSAAAQTGITLNVDAGSLIVSKNALGVSGFSFRFLDKDRNGFDIPFGLSFRNSDIFTETGTEVSTSVTISSGFRYVNRLFSNDFIRVNMLPGFYLAYTGIWTSRVQDYEEEWRTDYNDATSQHSVTLGFTANMEVEVPIGKIFSLPADAICLASGLSVTVSGAFNVYSRNDKYEQAGMMFSVNTGSYGTSITSLGIRYYF